MHVHFNATLSCTEKYEITPKFVSLDSQNHK